MKQEVKYTRLSLEEKNADNFAWFKRKADELKGKAFTSSTFNGEVSEYKRKKVNYDLFNGIIDVRDFSDVCKPFGAKQGDLPASFTNKDITSRRIKRLLGMEMKRPFSWRSIAINEEATTRKEEEEFGRIREFVISQTMSPIREQIEQKYQAETKGRELSQQEKKQISEQIAQELQAQTPDQVRKYMQREHQDPAEAMSHQLLKYLEQKKNIQRKFNKMWKHALLAGEPVCWVGIVNGEPDIVPTNALRFDYDKSPDVDFIEDGEWAVAEYRMSPTQVISQFGSELTDNEIDEIMSPSFMGAAITDADFTFEENNNDSDTIGVYHCVYKDLRRVGFLTFFSEETGEIEERPVSEDYKLNKSIGDLELNWEWLPEAYETYIIGNDIYAFPRPVEGQFKDINDMYRCKLPYYGAPFDNLNSETTSLMDRMKVWQYYYNIIMYRIELLMASDKGKIMLMNINSIPKSAGIDIETWMYYAEAMKIGWVNPNEEGSRGLDVTQMAKEIDMSLMSDIQKYIELATYIERQCGESVGIPDDMTGNISASASVGNTRENIAQNNHILEPYFELFGHVKKNVLEALLEQAKIAYADSTEKLTYVLDDLSIKMLELDGELLNNSSYGIFVANSSNAHEAIELVKQMAHAAMQNDTINLSDVIKVIRTEGIQEAEEQLVISEDKKREEVQAAQLNAIKEQGKNDEKIREFEREKMEFDRETGERLEAMKADKELQKQAMLSVGFNEDKDMDNDGQLDVLEILKAGKDADIKERKQTLDERKFEQQKKQDSVKNKLENKKIDKQNKSKT
jgi:hypothetical protein